ncbi:hypothetical protein [Sinorhizobium meliloti]|uniref:hypothetical protein n=1 Tax=Rhizobium meliloti TaxID=382 RepID=UPI00398D158A
MYVPPWTILAGLGALDRRELADLLVNFEATTLWTISRDRFTDLVERFQKGAVDSEVTSFARRLRDVSEKKFSSDVSTSSLRLQLWARIAQSLEIDPKFPLSTRVANAHCAALAHAAAAVISHPLTDDDPEEQGTVFRDVVRRLKSVTKSADIGDFEFLVNEKAKLFAVSLAQAAQAGELQEEDAAAIETRVRDYLETLPPELQDEAIREALKRGDNVALLLAASGTSALAVGLGVNLAGFSAYILAAQASAFIPLVSGPAAVSTLFMLANPLFSVPAVAGLGYLASRHVNGKSASRLAANVIIHLSLRGLSAGKEGLGFALDEFRRATPRDIATLPNAIRDGYLDRVNSITRLSGHPLPAAPREFPSAHERGGFSHLLEGLMSTASGDKAEIAAVATLTIGDIVYNAASIDPLVVGAADFSRAEDIADIFAFGQFADRVGSMSDAAAAGAGNNIRGYVSEQLVAARLVESGHVVEFPATSNNPGFDLLVDGNAFQIKCLSDIEGLRKHFERYPDMPVYANGELAEAVLASGEAWASKVFYIEGFDREIADLVMRTSLEAGEALGDLNVPYFAMAISTARNLQGWWRGRVPLADLPLSVLLDNNVKGGLAAVGGLSGKALGLLAFGPAGALVLGSVGGIGALVGAGWTREQAARLLSAEWLEELDMTTERFRTALGAAIQSKIELLRQKQVQLPGDDNPVRNWIDNRFSDDIVSMCEAAYDLDGSVSALRQPTKARACLEIMREANVHPIAVEAEMTALLDILGSEPSKTQSAGKKASQAWIALKSKLPSRT